MQFRVLKPAYRQEGRVQMIKNDNREREFSREQKKIHFAHFYGCSDHVPRGKHLKNRLKYPKQMISEELEEAV